MRSVFCVAELAPRKPFRSRQQGRITRTSILSQKSTLDETLAGMYISFKTSRDKTSIYLTKKLVFWNLQHFLILSFFLFKKIFRANPTGTSQSDTNLSSRWV